MSVQAPEKLAAVPEAPTSQAPMFQTSLAAFLSTAAAVWMAAGAFTGVWARVVGLVAAGIGAGGAALSARTRRPSLVQALVLPAGLALGIVAALPDAGGESLWGLVSEALRSGGLGRDPVPFDPGWRIVLAVLATGLGAAAASLALATERPKIALLVPVPVFLGAGLLHPPAGELASGAVATGLLVAALAVAFGVDLAAEGVSGGAFEARRLARGGATAGALVLGILAISRAGFLFPEPVREPVIPPRLPEPAPPQPDRVLFTATAERPGPWRLGTLDVYDGEAWRMPPYDAGRYAAVADDGRVPGSDELDESQGVSEATFRIVDPSGRVLPVVANPIEVTLTGAEIDPRTQELRLAERRARPGLTYTVTNPRPPTGEQLATAGPAAGEAFTDAPVPPNEIATLLDDAPANEWDRLQFVRDRLYEEVVAAGAGDPVAVPPSRVVELLGGGEATPFEITAAEALLARWAGVPSRIGYGYFGGDRRDDAYEVHPRHGATWLEVAFAGHGWVPVVGVPPRARSTLRSGARNPDPSVLPTDELALVVYVPVELGDRMLFVDVVRWWLARVLPAVALALAMWWWALPAAAKAVRGIVRRRRARSARARIVVAYAQLRDACRDLGIGDHAMTPVELTDVVEPDPEHDELAALVTRALWGDLGRDLRDEDAEAAEAMARSVATRLRRARSIPARLAARGSRASLRDPYTTEVANLWPGWARRGAIRAALRSMVSAAWSRRPRIRPSAAVLLLFVMVWSGCAGGEGSVPVTVGLPERIVPDSLSGYTFHREPKAEKAYERAGENSIVADGRVFTIRREPATEGSLQVAAFTPRAVTKAHELRRGVLDTVGTGAFELTRLGGERVWVQRLPEQRLLLWFSPGTTYYQLMVARRDFADAEQVFVDVLRYRQGRGPSTDGRVREPYDPRRGAEL